MESASARTATTAGAQSERGATATFTARIAPRVIAANLLGAILVYLYLALIAPPESASHDSVGIEIATFVGYLVVAVFAGMRAGRRTFAPVARWLDEDRTPTRVELESTLEQPLRHAGWVFALWCIGTVMFAAWHMVPGNPIHHDPGYGLFIGAVSFLGGLASSMLSYLLIDQLLRPVFARALAQTTPLRAHALGVRQRLGISWALGSGVVLVAIALIPFGSSETTVALWFLVPVGLIAGGSIMSFAARSVARRIEAMRQAVAEIEKGNFDAHVVVDDASEVGVLQAGLNKMAAGLRERERLRTVFGTYVDPEIADHILREGTSLAGEEVEVTIMFLDVRDFTGYAESRPAAQVVATINRLFEVVVPIIHEHKGHVDKFVGDGLLAVFGAPRRLDRHADLALGAAVDIATEVRAKFEGGLEVGIGLNSGVVVAGNVGGAGRLDFSVIGDPVNVAARVEAATRETGDTILISDRTKELLTGGDQKIEARPGLKLKGKRHAVSVFAVALPPEVGARPAV